MLQFKLTPALENDIAICRQFADKQLGAPTPDLSNVDSVKAAANRLYAAAHGPVADGVPNPLFDQRVVELINANAASLRASIQQNLMAGKTDPTDYYDVLYRVLSESGEMTSNTLPLSSSMAKSLHANLSAVDLAKDHCALCAACAICSSCSACSACGTCIASVVVGAAVTLATASVLTVGGIAGYLFSSAAAPAA